MATVKKHDVQPDGSFEVTYTDPPFANGQPAVTRWSIPPSQLGQHAPMFRAEMKAGDRAAFDDAVNEFKKQRDA